MTDNRLSYFQSTSSIEDSSLLLYYSTALVIRGTIRKFPNPHIYLPVDQKLLTAACKLIELPLEFRPLH